MSGYGGPFECPSGLHGNVWCTCPAPLKLRPRQPFEGVDPASVKVRPGHCHECSEAFKADEPLVTVFMPPRFNGGHRIMHVNCTQRVLARVEFKKWH
jgi:hypothetical protein